MKEQISKYITELLYDIAATDSQIVLLAVLLVATVIVLDAISALAKRKRKETGIEKKEPDLKASIVGLKSLPVRDYISDMQKLSGRPDALISEDGYIIPIERKPLSNKIRDRYVAQLLVYMRLVEEFEGKKPPYGYLILGTNCRKVRISNSAQRQAWLQKYLDEMHAILNEEAQAVPAPHPIKCRKCAVRQSCHHSAAE